MEITETKNKKICPLKDLIAFTWLSPKSKSGILLPSNFSELDYREGRFYLGTIIAVGPKVTSLKPKDIILIHEYGIKDFSGGWKEDKIYFIEEENCKALVKDPSRGLLELQRTLSKDQEKDLIDA